MAPAARAHTTLRAGPVAFALFLLVAGCGPDSELDVVAEPDIPEHGDGLGVSEDELSRQQLHGSTMATKYLSLTFDDGPGPRTVELAEYLHAQGIRATFFVNGRNVVKFPRALQRLVELGHLVGNHTQTHAKLTTSTMDAAYAELAQTDSLTDDWVPPSTFVFRAPYGAWSPELADSLNQTDMKKYVGSISWNIGGTLTTTYAADWACWSSGLSVSTCAQRYLKEVTDRTKGVVLMHDVHGKTVDMVKVLVPQLKRAGYKFQRVDGVPAIYSALATTSPSAAVGLAKRHGVDGYWVAWADGRVMGFGGAVSHGPAKAFTPVGPIVSIAATTTSAGGYWLLTRNGGIYPYGAAGYFSSPRRAGVTATAVAMVATPSSQGYWVATSDGGLYPYGDAPNLGSLLGKTLPAPIAAMARTSTGKGMWLVTTQGHVYGLGDAVARGGLNGTTAAPIVGITRSATNGGYWLLASNGMVSSFGDAPSYGSVTSAVPLVGMAATATANGTWVSSRQGAIFRLGSAPALQAQ